MNKRKINSAFQRNAKKILPETFKKMNSTCFEAPFEHLIMGVGLDMADPKVGYDRISLYWRFTFLKEGIPGSYSGEVREFSPVEKLKEESDLDEVFSNHIQVLADKIDSYDSITKIHKAVTNGELSEKYGYGMKSNVSAFNKGMIHYLLKEYKTAKSSFEDVLKYKTHDVETYLKAKRIAKEKLKEIEENQLA